MFREIVHSRLFMKTFMYYTIILIVPILIFSTVSYNYNIQKSKANAIRKCNEEAKNITSLIDGQLKSIQSLGGRIDMLSWVWKLAAETDIPDDGFTAIQRKDIINDLRIYMTDHVLLKDVILFFPKKDAAISLSGWFTIESFFNYLGKDEKILKLKEQLINEHNFAVLYKNGIDIKNRSVLCLMHSIDKAVEPRAQAIFLIDENRIKQFIRSISPDNLNNFEIITSEGEAIIQVANGNESNNKRMFSLIIPSNSFGWTYFSQYNSK